MARGMSKEEFWKTVYKSELIAKMSDNRLNAYDANFSKPNFEEEFYDYCMGDGSKPRTNDESIESFFGEGRETVQEQDVDVTSDDVEYDLQHVKEEMADVMVYCQNLLDKLGLDADEIINMKMAQNEAKYPVEKAKGSAAKYNQL